MERGPLVVRDLLPPRHEAGAAPALDERRGVLLERVGHGRDATAPAARDRHVTEGTVSASTASIDCHERRSDGSWYSIPGMPTAPASGFVKLWAAPP